MKAYDTIPAISTVEKYVILFNGQFFGEFPANALKLPCKAYVPIFGIVNHLFNVSMPKKDRKKMLKISGMSGIIGVFSGMLPEEDLENFVREDAIMQAFEIIPENEYVEKTSDDTNVGK